MLIAIPRVMIASATIVKLEEVSLGRQDDGRYLLDSVLLYVLSELSLWICEVLPCTQSHKKTLYEDGGSCQGNIKIDMTECSKEMQSRAQPFLLMHSIECYCIISSASLTVLTRENHLLALQ
ncbi:hypothetical protein Tco_1051769 [Tanacetum coccineum]